MNSKKIELQEEEQRKHKRMHIRRSYFDKKYSINKAAINHTTRNKARMRQRWKILIFPE